MKVYVINLDKDKEKMASIDAQLRRLGVEYERFPAIYAKEMPEDERDKAVNRFRWWCAMGRPIAPAEIGCALSHFAIYRQIEEPVCILEDDVILGERFKENLAQVESFVDTAKPQVVMLSDHTGMYRNVEVIGGAIRRSSTAMCTDGYVITPAAGKALLEQNCPIIVPCDTWGRWSKQGKIEIYHALPNAVSQDQVTFGSSTFAERVVVADLPPARWMWHKAKRCVGRAVDLILVKVTGR